MEPATRLVFEYPVYAMDMLEDGSIAVCGGGGRMKSGIPNACEVVSFDEQTCTLSRVSATQLTDAPVALATHCSTVTAIVGSGCKNFNFKPPNQLTPESNFTHDLQVHSKLEQNAIAISRNGHRLAVASDQGHLTVVQLPHREMLLGKQIHTQGIIDLSIAPDGDIVATTARDKTAYISRVDSAHLVQDVKPVMPGEMRTHIRAVRFAPSDPSVIFTAESNPRKGGWIAAWRSPNPEGGNWSPVASIKASSDALTAFAINDTGDIAAVSSSEGHVVLFRWNGTSFTRTWTSEPGRYLFRPPPAPHNLPVTAMRFSKSGTYLLTASADYSVAAWPIQPPTNWRRIFTSFIRVCVLLLGVLAVMVVDRKSLSSVVNKGMEYASPHVNAARQALERYSTHIERTIESDVEERRKPMRQEYAIPVPTRRTRNTPQATETRPAWQTPDAQPVLQTPESQPGLQAPKSQPKLRSPMPQPATQVSESQPAVQTPKSQPALQTPKSQPALHMPASMSAVQTSWQHVMSQAPEAQPALQTPEPQPSLHTLKSQPELQTLEPRPALETFESQPALLRPGPQPSSQTPVFQTVLQALVPKSLQTPGLQPLMPTSQDRLQMFEIRSILQSEDLLPTPRIASESQPPGHEADLQSTLWTADSQPACELRNAGLLYFYDEDRFSSPKLYQYAPLSFNSLIGREDADLCRRQVASSDIREGAGASLLSKDLPI